MAGALFAILTGAAAWVASLAGRPQTSLQKPIGVQHSDNIHAALGLSLSRDAVIHLPGSGGFDTATDRWNPWRNPQFDVVVEVITEDDVVQTVSLTASIHSGTL